MPERLEAKPIYVVLIEAVEETGTSEHSLTMEELHELFKRQAEVDDSDDNPILLSNFVAEVTPNGLHLFTPYTVSDLDNPEKRVGLAIEGVVGNNPQGVLSSEEYVDIYTDTDTRIRVLEAFGQEGESTLSVTVFLKLMLENALEGKVTIDNMRLDGDKLGVTVRKA